MNTDTRNNEQHEDSTISRKSKGVYKTDPQTTVLYDKNSTKKT